MANAGTFREWVTIYTPTLGPDDGIGGRLEAPETELTTWASVTEKPAKESMLDGQMRIKRPYVIVIRYVNDPAVDEQARVVYEDKSISIYSVIHDSKKTVTTLYGYAD